MQIMFNQLMLLLLFIGAGFLLGRMKIADSRETRLLSCLEVYVFLPANVFRTFSANFTPAYLSEKYSFVLVSLVLLTLLYLGSRPLAKWLTPDAYRQKVLRYTFAIANYGYIGYALTDGVFGELALLNVMVFALPLSLFTPTIGFCLLTNAPVSLKKLVNAQSMALVAGALVGLTGLALPETVNIFMEKAADCMAPVSMLLTGLVLSEYRLRDLVKGRLVYFVTALRLLVIPGLIGLLLKLLSLEEMILPALMITAMPCGLNTIVYPRLVGEDCRLGASMVFVSTLLCCVTIPLCLSLFGLHVG